MKVFLSISICLIFFFLSLNKSIGQAVSINITGTAPDTSSILDVKSTTKGVLLPRMTTTQRTTIGTPAEGLLVYDTTTHTYWYRNNTSWINIAQPISAPPPTPPLFPLIPVRNKQENKLQGILEAQNGMIQQLIKQNLSLQNEMKILNQQMTDLINTFPEKKK
ncbi:MAG: hypothetical protein ABJC12_03645 [Saprospiraceae bacterium]